MTIIAANQQISGKGTFVPLSFVAGEAFQFDWSDDWAIIDGVRTKLQVAHFKLSYSRAFFVRAYLLQTHEMLFDADNHAFRVLGGVPRRGIIDRSHDRPGRTVYDWRHYLAVVRRKPGALRNGAPFLGLPAPFQQLQRHLLRTPGGDREVVEILALVLRHDQQVVLVGGHGAGGRGSDQDAYPQPVAPADRR